MKQTYLRILQYIPDAVTPRITTTPTVTDTINTILVSPSGVDESPVDKIGVREVKKARFLDELETQMTLNAKVDVYVVVWDDYEMRAMGGWMGLVLYEDFTPIVDFIFLDELSKIIDEVDPFYLLCSQWSIFASFSRW